MTGNTFIGGVPGSQETQNIANVSGSVVAASATVDMTTPGYSAALAPAAPTPSLVGNYDRLTLSPRPAIATAIPISPRLSSW